MNARYGQTLTLGQLLDLAVSDYWRNRPRCFEVCGSVQGYYRHRYYRTTPCQPCREARRMVVAIMRRRGSA